MRFSLPRLALNLLATLAFLNSPLHADETSIRKSLEKRLEFPIVSVTKTPYLGLYEVYTGERLMYTDEKMSVLFIGNLIDLPAMKNVTDERMAAINAINFNELPFDQAIKQVHGNGKRLMATFEDPNCGYCKRLAKDLSKVDNVTIYTFIVPLLGPDSTKKSGQIWCSADRVKSWNDWMISNKALSGTSDCDTTALRSNQRFAEKYRINGTPTLLFASNERAPGLIPLDRIEQMLGK